MRPTEKNSLKKQIGNDLLGIEWSRDRWRSVTLKGQGHDPNTLTAQYLENSWRWYLGTLVSLLWVCLSVGRKWWDYPIATAIGFLFCCWQRGLHYRNENRGFKGHGKEKWGIYRPAPLFYVVAHRVGIAGGWGLNPQFMSTEYRRSFWVKIGFKFQSLGKISNISTFDPSSFRSVPTLVAHISVKIRGGKPH